MGGREGRQDGLDASDIIKKGSVRCDDCGDFNARRKRKDICQSA